MEAIIAALITGGLALVGVIITNNKNQALMDAKLDKQMAVINTEIKGLTQQVEKHNKVVERTFKLEERASLLEEDVKVANHRINDLEHLNKQ